MLAINKAGSCVQWLFSCRERDYVQDVARHSDKHTRPEPHGSSLQPAREPSLPRFTDKETKAQSTKPLAPSPEPGSQREHHPCGRRHGATGATG